MTDDEILKDLFNNRGGIKKVIAALQWAEVISVNQDEKTMDVKALSDGLEVYDVQLGTGSVIIYPKPGTMCLIGMIEDQNTDAILISAEKVDKVEITASTEISFNGGENGGLINIDALTDKINGLVKTFNDHTHLVNTQGTATAQSGTAQATLSKAMELNKADYEDKKIKH